MVFALRFGARAELAEVFQDLIGFEMDAFDLVIEAATLNSGPLDDGGGGGAEGVAHVRLLINFF